MSGRMSRLLVPGSWLFSLCILMSTSCSSEKGEGDVSVVSENERPVAIFIPSDFILGIKEDQVEREVVIRISGKKEKMLGTYVQDNYGVEFRPLIGLTPGQRYEVLYRGKLIVNLDIPSKVPERNVHLLGIYPSSDTLPENLLKFYLIFSKPMRRGVSADHLTLTDEGGKTLREVFLNLNTELWDESGRKLTVWLHPGRIKRGLQPNVNDGQPLKAERKYTLRVSASWPDLKGNPLDRDYQKSFTTHSRDVTTPKLTTWKINIPSTGSRQALAVFFNESLDHELLLNSISVIHRDGQEVRGKIFIKDNERSFYFYPEYHWAPGTYNLKVDSRLEDLAGNNLNRLFDVDLLSNKTPGTEQFHTRRFTIR